MPASPEQVTSSLLSNLLVPVAGPDDARATARALRDQIGDELRQIVVLHVIRKAGGAPDAASVEQMESWAEESFAAFDEEGGAWLDGVDCIKRYQFGTDVVETILSEAESIDATAIAYTPRPGHALLRWLSGDTAAELAEESHLPVVAVPDVEDVDES